MDQPDPRTADLGFARVDVDRAARTGDPEVVYGAGKTPEQVVAILRTLHERHPDRAVLATRLADEALDLLAAELPDAARRPRSPGPPPSASRPRRAAPWRSSPPAPPTRPVAAEAALTVRVHGAGVDRIDDVGVAGLHRLLAVRDRLAEADCLVVVAGMEGALPSVVGGLIGVPLVAVPTSVGYGASFGGLAALLGDAQLLRPRRHRGQHRQRVRRRRLRRAGGPRRDATARTTRGRRPDDGARPRSGSTPPPAPAATCCSAPCSAPGSRSRCCRPRSTRSPRSRSRCGSSEVARAGFAATRCHVELRRLRARTAPGATSATLLAAAPPRRAGPRPAPPARFERLADAEGAVHGSDPLEVHFHEVGALDAIADVVGVCAGFVHLGAGRRRRLPRGGRLRHGAAARTARLPVPPPAVAQLLRGVPSYAGPGARPRWSSARPPGPRC